MPKLWFSLLLCFVMMLPMVVQANENKAAANKPHTPPPRTESKDRSNTEAKPNPRPVARKPVPPPASMPARPVLTKPATKPKSEEDEDEDEDSTPPSSPQGTSQEPPLYSIDTPTSKSPPTNSNLGQILKNQVLRVCVRADIPPFGHFFNHTLVGFDIQLAQEIATQLSIYYKKNLRLSWLIINAGARIQSLVENHCDMVVAAFSITASREKLVSFSAPYLQTYKVVVKKTKITRTSPIIGLVSGTTTGGQKLQGKIQYFRNYNEIIHAMERGSIDYTVTDQPIAIHMLRSVTQAYSIIQVLPEAENYGVGLSKKSEELRQAVNRALRDIARSGRLAYTQRQWL